MPPKPSRRRPCRRVEWCDLAADDSDDEGVPLSWPDIQPVPSPLSEAEEEAPAVAALLAMMDLRCESLSNDELAKLGSF